jgi:Methyltransferase domain
MLNWMRSVEKIPSIPAIMTGLVEMCEWIEANCGLVEPDYSNMVMYELGSFAGESAEVFAKYFGTVHCVDPWGNACGAPSAEDVENSFDERAKKAGNIVKHKATGTEIALLVQDRSVDFVYIDAGAHTYEECLRDITEWWPKVRSGGFLGGHDFEIKELHAADTFPGVERAVNRYFGQRPDKYGLKVFPDTSWVVRKP